jgi:hypothetical protein
MPENFTWLRIFHHRAHTCPIEPVWQGERGECFIINVARRKTYELRPDGCNTRIHSGIKDMGEG